MRRPRPRAVASRGRVGAGGLAVGRAGLTRAAVGTRPRLAPTASVSTWSEPPTSRPACCGPPTGRPGRSGRRGRRTRTPTTACRRCCGASSRCATGLARARLYATAHGLYEVELNGQRVGDDVLAPGWTATPPAALPDLRRHRAAVARAPTPSAPGSATAGTAAASASTAAFRNLYGDRPRRSSPSSRSTYADGSRRRRRHRRALAAPRRPDRRAPALRRRDATTRALRAAGLVARPASTTPAGRRSAVVRARPGHARRAARARRCGAPRTLTPVEVLTDAGGAHHPRLRPEPRRPPAHPRRRARAGDTRHAAPRRGAGGRRALHRARCAAPATDQYTLRGGGRRGVGAALHLPRLPLRRGRPAGRASSRPPWQRATRRSGLPHRHGAHRLVRLLRPAASTACTRTSCGACAATSSTSPPTARSATSASAGPATSRSSRPPPPSSTTARACSPPGCADLAAEQRPTGTVPWYVPVDPGHELWTPIRPARPGATPRRSCPWVLYQRFGRRRQSSPAQYDSAKALGRPRRAPRRARPPVGRRASSSATGSTPPRRRRTRPTPRPTAYLVATAYFAWLGAAPGRHGRRPGPRRRRGALRRAGRRGPRTPSPREYVSPDGPA